MRWKLSMKVPKLVQHQEGSAFGKAVRCILPQPKRPLVFNPWLRCTVNGAARLLSQGGETYAAGKNTVQPRPNAHSPAQSGYVV